MTAQMLCSAGRADRLKIDADATLRASGWAPIDIEIEDISVSGFRMVAPANLPLGELISIGIGGLGMQPAIVVRREEQIYGCRFVNAVTAEQVAQLGSGLDQVVTPLVGAAERQPETASVDKSLSPGLRLVITAVIAILSWTLVVGVALLSFKNAI